MTRQQMVRQISKKTRQYENIVSDILHQYIDLLRQELINGETVTIRNFVTLHVADRHPRCARDPKTGEVKYFPNIKVVKCRASRNLRKEINGVIPDEDADEEEEE